MTQSVADLRTAVTSLRQLQASFVTDDRDDGWRHRLVQRRRMLQQQIAAIGQSWQEIERDVGATEVGQRFRRGFIDLRARFAGHQAAWPAVAIDQTDPQFLASRDVMRSANTEFHAAATALLDMLDDRADKDLNL